MGKDKKVILFLCCSAFLLLISRVVFLLLRGDPAMDFVGATAVSGIPLIFIVIILYQYYEEKMTKTSNQTLKSKDEGLRKDVGPNTRIRRALANARIPSEKNDNDVLVDFHTYTGFLVYLEQRHWKYALPPVEAKEVLWLMHKTNLIWGWTCPGAIFIPILSFISYRRQLRSIRIQRQSLK